MEKENTSESYPKIDIEKVIASKSEKLAKVLPGFIVRYLKKILHQDELNDFLSRNHQKQGIDFADSVLEELDITFEVKGFENIKTDGRYIFACNHPLGGPDGLILISLFGKHFKTIRFLVNDILMNIKNMGKVFVPINKHGGQAKEAAKIIEAAYSSDSTILTFPAGLVSRKQQGVIKDLEWKKSFIVKAKKHERDIVPLHIDGRNSNFFYRLANLRKFLGLKSNLEMLYLPNELFKQRGKKFTVRIGKPISYQTFDSSLSYDKWAEKMKRATYNLADQ
ncbi:1-acyl-sn-glycerol-3-phosphate acyltransferase [Labilibaculum sp. DW002]|uniref:1-acyl-sn-glycerol-3-phosphate acyltransferase n=1 Tax=Paralabilibaculum antarcticum TaxID=2912572 RepID=A0ABT5VXJ3_9BACT|nr:1-acyl-sn-glycerol-3-phosphate acyltransferase [Labilibaculum sp. DW002]MDE5420125.1 1-acyl-sn-glycerol-3-phosphate acyltransferase [Labilibaculum sp. DW002]